MRILGIDPGTATTGYGLIEEDDQGQLMVVEYGVFLTPAGMPAPERLLKVYQKLTEYILLHQPDLAAVEKLFSAECQHRHRCRAVTGCGFTRLRPGRHPRGGVYPQRSQTGCDRVWRGR